MAQTEIGELLHHTGSLQRFFNIYRKSDAAVQPSLDLGVMRLVRRAGCAAEDIAFPRPKFGWFEERLAGPEILLFQQILVAESFAERAVAPLVERQSNGRLVPRMRNQDCILPAWTHLEEDV